MIMIVIIIITVSKLFKLLVNAILMGAYMAHNFYMTPQIGHAQTFQTVLSL